MDEIIERWIRINKSKIFNDLKLKASEIIESDLKTVDKLNDLCKLLKNNIYYYNWVGVYLVDKQMPHELVLISHYGESTEHVRIPFGRGICGQAAVLKKSLIVQDVKKESNYLPCSEKVKSEIVVPIFRKKEIIAELDIDSHIVSPFTSDDDIFLKEIAKMASKIL